MSSVSSMIGGPGRIRVGELHRAAAERDISPGCRQHQQGSVFREPPDRAGYGSADEPASKPIPNGELLQLRARELPAAEVELAESRQDPRRQHLRRQLRLVSAERSGHRAELIGGAIADVHSHTNGDPAEAVALPASLA